MTSIVQATLVAGLLVVVAPGQPLSQLAATADLDQRVRSFLDRHRNDWHDLMCLRSMAGRSTS